MFDMFKKKTMYVLIFCNDKGEKRYLETPSGEVTESIKKANYMPWFEIEKYIDMTTYEGFVFIRSEKYTPPRNLVVSAQDELLKFVNCVNKRTEERNRDIIRKKFGGDV